MASEKMMVYVALPSGVTRWVPSVEMARKTIAKYSDSDQMKMDYFTVPCEKWELDEKGEVDVPF